MAQKMQAKWNGEVLAESDQTVVVEGNHYFPAESVTATLLPSETTSVCPWKGTSSYYSIEAGGETNRDAAWFYPDPKPEAEQIRDRIAFWKGVEVAPA